MDADTTAEIAELRAEIAQLRMEMLQAQSGDMAGGEGVDNGLPLVPIGGEPQGAFRIDDGKVVDCHFLFGRTTVTINDFPLDGDGLYSLSIPHSSAGSATIVKNTSDINSLTQTIIPLFRISNGSVVVDYRGMPVIPVRE